MADRPARMVSGLVDRVRSGAPLAGWIVTAAMGLVAISQALGFSWIPLLWALQAFTPFVLAPAVPVALVAAWRRRRTVAAVHAGLSLCLLVLVLPVVLHERPTVPADAARLTVAQGNVYYRTDRPSEVAAAMLATDADVLAFTEFSQPVADALAAAGAASRYPFRADEAPGDRNGVALLSRYPITSGGTTRVGRSLAVDATLDVDGSAVRVVVVHPLPGTDRESLAAWTHDLPAIGALADPDDPATSPTIVVGDLNATRWHPALRDVLDRGWRDAHELLGRGWSASWPTDLPGPALVRIDHALLSRRVVPVSVHDVALPGSDHRGFVLDVAIVE